MPTEKGLVVFRIGETEFGFNIESVEEVVAIPKISKLFQLPVHIAGVMSLRGRVVPVADARLFLGDHAPVPADDRRVFGLRFEDGDREAVLAVGEMPTIAQPGEEGPGVIRLTKSEILQETFWRGQ